MTARKDDRILDRIPPEKRQGVESCWADPVNGTIWIILLPGWSYRLERNRVMHLESLDVVARAFMNVRD